MFAIPGIVLLVAAIYARPQEIFGWLAPVPLLYLLFALAVFGMALDLRAGNTRLSSTPALVPIAVFALWALGTSVIRAPAGMTPKVVELSICVALYLLLAHGVQSFRALGAVAGMVLAMVILVSAVAVHQSMAPTGCIQIDESIPGDTASGRHDGRPCEWARDCYLGDAEPGAEYMCEHVGLLGTTSVGHGRVRYRGVLQDPNELGLVAAIGLPLGFAIARSRRKAPGRGLLLVSSFLLVLACAVLTRSRTAQIVFLAVLAVLFARRFGVRGLLLASVLAAPLLVLGGRAGMEASSSMLERVDCWAEALSIWRAHPFLGAGLGQFGAYHYLTAHNSYLLALAELGLPGMWLFTAIVYLTVKIPLTAWNQSRLEGSVLASDAALPAVQPWSLGLLAAYAGLAVGIFFLSFTYHYVLWIYAGLSGALYSAIRRHHPAFVVRFGWRDALLITLIDAGIVVTVYLYARQALG